MNRRVGGNGYSNDLRDRIVHAVWSGKNRNTVARQFSVHRQTVDLYMIKAELGTLHQRRYSEGRPCIVQECHEEKLLEQVKLYPDATLKEHAQILEDAEGPRISSRTVARVFQRHGITLKKRRSSQLSEMKKSDRTI